MTGKHVETGETVADRSDSAKKSGEPAAPQIVGLRHVGMVAENPAALARFYRDALGLQVVGGSDADNAFGATAFLSSNPAKESHQIAIFADPAFCHIAFKVGTLADLRVAYRRIVDMGVPIKMALNHGVSLAFYFQDPEENLVEIYWATGLACDQPHGDPLDLTLPEEALRQEVERLARQTRAQNPLSAIQSRAATR